MDKTKIWDIAPKQLDRILSFFARVEAKASFIFAVDSALLGTLAVHVERSDFEKAFTVLLLIFFGIALAASGSTQMVETLSWQRCAEIYKTYLYCASRMIRDNNGEVVAFDGDRVMGIFLGDSQSSNAAKCAMRINWILKELINPLYQKQYSDSYSIGHTIGIDVSEARCCRTGVRGDNDLVWVGSAANVAAKLTSLDEYPIWITDAVFNRLAEWAKLGKDGRQMWEARLWTAMNNRSIYRSNWWWAID